MTTTGGDIVEELRLRGADSTLIANNAYVRAADEIELLRVEGTPESRAELDDALARAMLAEAEVERLRVAAGILQKLAMADNVDTVNAIKNLAFSAWIRFDDTELAYLAALESGYWAAAAALEKETHGCCCF